MITDFDSHIRHRDELIIQPIFLPLCYQYRVSWYEGKTLSWRWFETKTEAHQFAVKVLLPDDEFTTAELAKAVAGIAAMQEHDAKVAANKGLHGDQLVSVQRHVRKLRAAAAKLAKL